MKDTDIEVYGYCRVSTDEQEKLGFSITEQEIDLYGLSRKLGNEIPKENMFVDDGYSASNLKRPNIQALIRRLTANYNRKFLYIRHPDRLVRNLMLKRSLEYAFEKYNVTVITIYSSWKGEDTEASMVADITMLFAENEIKKIPQRVKDGYRGSALNGNYPLGGKNVPRGYRKEFNKRIGKGYHLVPDDKNAIEVVKIFNTMATNRLTVRQMAKYLDKNRVMEKRWNEKQLLLLLDNPIYYGRLVREWFDSEDPNILDSQKGLWYSSTCHTEPLVSKALWLEVNKIVHNRKSMTKHSYLFKRLVQCKNCGTYLTCDPAWKTKRNKKDKVLYKYFYCKQCNKRINEMYLFNHFVENYGEYKREVQDTELIHSLQTKIVNTRKRIEYLNNDYDNGMIDDETYNMSVRIAYQTIKANQKEIEMIKASSDMDFEKLTHLQKRAIIVANVEKVEVDLFEKKCYFHYKE